MESLRNQWESMGFLKGFCRSFYNDDIGISVRIRWGFNEIIFHECLQDFNGILQQFYADFKGVLKDFKWMLYGVCQVSRRIPKGMLKGVL